MSLKNKIISMLAGAAMLGVVSATAPVESATSVYATSIHVSGEVRSGRGGRITINGTPIYIDGNGNVICDNNNSNNTNSNLESKLEGKKILTCDEINCTSYIINNGKLEQTGFITPTLDSIRVRINNKSYDFKNKDIIELEANDSLIIDWAKIEMSDEWKAFHNSNVFYDIESRSGKTVVNFRGFDSGSEIHEDRGYEIKRSDLIEKYRNRNGTWSVQVLDRDNSDVKIGEVYIRYKNDTPKKPKIFLEIAIDQDTKVKDYSYFTEVLLGAGFNLYNNFGIYLKWEFCYFNSPEGMNTRKALNVGGVPGKSAFLIYLEDNTNDDLAGIISERKIVVDIRDFECTVHTTLHELGHLFGLRYQTSDPAHPDGCGYIMNTHCGDCSLTWHPESRRQIMNRLNTGRLDHLLSYR